jgi:hypothetical protein
MQMQSNAIIDTCIEIAFYMRGGIQYEDAFNLTPAERSRIINFISKRIENEMKKPFKTPIY